MEVEDSTYSSTSEAEPDSDHEDFEIDHQKLLGTWLGELESVSLGLELESLTSGLQSISSKPAMEKTCFATPRIDSYRFSMANMEDSQDGELDAILGELCAVQNHIDEEIINGARSHQRSASSISQSSGVSSLDPRQQHSNIGGGIGGGLTPSHSIQRFSHHSRSSSGGTRVKFEINSLHGDLEGNEDSGRKLGDVGPRTDSPDNDSAFSDTVSMLSSESSASSGGGGVNGRTDLSSQSTSSKSSNASLASSPTQLNADNAARIKAEKIKIALEKIREANIKKLFIKAFTVDGSAKSLLIDEKMSVGYVTKLLVDKNHVTLDPKWSIVEHIPELYMERVFEDNENLVENLLVWARDSKNRLLFLERSDKYDLFLHPENYLLLGSTTKKDVDFDDDSRNALVDEFFTGSGVSVPEVEGNLYLKSDGKKAWKKHYFVLRASGLYYCPKGKSKLSKDLVCLVTFDTNHVYLGAGWKKKYKSPTEYGFAIKHPQVQTKASKYIKYLCAEDEKSLLQWVTSIRIAKQGRQLLDNYRMLLQDMAEEDLEALAHARSFSISSMARSGMSSQCTTPSAPTTPIYELADAPRAPSSSSGSSDTHSSLATPVSTLERNWGRRSMSRQDSVRSSSTGGSTNSAGLSERSGNGTPTGELYGFDSESFPMGTIKRKPSVNPKIPLTNTTRTLAKQSLGEDEFPTTNAAPEAESGLSRNGTLRKTLRRSLTDEKISIPELVSTLRRQQQARENSLTRNGSPAKSEIREVEEDSFPLPPPPEFAASTESLLSVESLPPPPPEAYKSNLSLDLLPPPQHELTNGVGASQTLTPSPTKVAGSNPPVPPPKPQQRVAQEIEAPLPLLISKSARKWSAAEHHPASHPPVLNGHSNGEAVKSPPVLRRITFRDEVGGASHKLIPNGRLAPPPPPLPPPPVEFASNTLRPRTGSGTLKPPPPRRSESTRLSARTLSHSPVTPPKTFLADLQRVMEKKWKVAQQLKIDINSSAHTVMGFRDPPLPSDVLCCTTHVDEKNRVAAAKAAAFAAAAAAASSPQSPPSPTTPQGNGFARGCRDSVRGIMSGDEGRASFMNKKKFPPPPPPKRSETTQLTGRI